MLRDNTYVLYLQKADTSMSGELVIMSGENGLIHLENLTEDQKFNDIIVKTLAEFECDMDEELKNELETGMTGNSITISGDKFCCKRK